MKEMFDWVPWFNELAKKIADGGQQYLDDRAREVIWHGESPLPNADAIDPLLFITVVANESEKTDRRGRVFASLAEVFEIHPLQTDDSRDVWHLPRPISLFEYGDSDNPVNRHLVWRFLKDAVAGSLDAETFESVGSRLRGINWAKLTTTLFLVDGAAYLRLSKNYPTAYGVSEVVGAPNWNTYQSRIAEAKANFPGCETYEVEMFARLHSSGAAALVPDLLLSSRSGGGWFLAARPDRCWVASCGTQADDQWREFREHNWVRVENSAEYPVDEPQPGEVVLARFGNSGPGIGLVYRNDYGEERKPDGRIHVLWLNKSSCELEGPVQPRAFDKASTRVVEAYRQPAEYAPTWHVLDGIAYRREVEVALAKDRRELGEVWRRLNAGEKISDIRATKGNAHTIRQIHRLLLEGRVPEAPSIRKAASRSVARFAREHEDEFSEATEEKLADLVAKCSEGRPSPSDESESIPEDDPSSGSTSPRLVKHHRNRILYGPPGTGKTYATVSHAIATVDGAHVREVTDADKELHRDLLSEGRLGMVTFHQNYSYEDFVEGIRPKLVEPDDRNGDVEMMEAAEAQASPDLAYELKHGVFRRICAAADRERRAARNEGREPERFVLVIDEINRGNIPKIFGELITLIEDSRRLGEDDATTVTLPYSGDDFGVPGNLYIVGTMNTADRSIQQLDTALRRRFSFVEMMPDPDHDLVPEDLAGVNCRTMLRAMNERIALLMDREHEIGHTYLLKVESIEDLADRFRNRIFPLLQEYFYDDWRRIDAVLAGNAFVQKAKAGDGYSKRLIEELDLFDEDRTIYSRLPDDNPAWTDAGEYQKIYEPKNG